MRIPHPLIDPLRGYNYHKCHKIEASKPLSGPGYSSGKPVLREQLGVRRYST